jgi:hypothetical protein
LWDGDHLEDPAVDRRIILKYTFEKWDAGACTQLIWLRIGRGGSYECGNEHSGSKKCGEIS